MGQSKEVSLRLKVVQAYEKEKLSYQALSERFQLNYHTVRTWCKRYNDLGIKGLSPQYKSSGRKVNFEHERSYRLIRLTKHLHPLWGVPYIVAKVKEDYPTLLLQSIRHYQRRLRAEPSTKVPPPKIPRSSSKERPRQAHDEWQIDAKERITLASGLPACYLNVTDTKSNAILICKAFPPQPD
ncbi:MAG: helix-turn-helix domain-containing protein [Bacteroidota bacterium]